MMKSITYHRSSIETVLKNDSVQKLAHTNAVVEGTAMYGTYNCGCLLTI